MFKILIALFFLLPPLSYSSDVPQPRIDLISERLKAARADIPIVGLSRSEVPGFTHVQMQGGELVAVSNDGQFLFAGPLYRITDTGFKDVADEKAAVVRAAYFKKNDPFKLGAIVFPAAGEVKKQIFVFTDITCGFCRKLHQETVPGLQAAGVEVHYLGFPREGLVGGAKSSLDTAFCSSDRQGALTSLKNNEEIEAKTCDSPVPSHYALAQEFGINSTPAIVMLDGTLIKGYMPADTMLQSLGIK